MYYRLQLQKCNAVFDKYDKTYSHILITMLKYSYLINELALPGLRHSMQIGLEE